MFRIYLRDSSTKSVSEKTNTPDRLVAIAAFEKLIARCELDGTKTTAAMTLNGAPVATHKFWAKPTDTTFFWRARTHQLPIHDKPGRPPQLTDGLRVNVYLDAQSLQVARVLGNGNVSLGIRAALRKVRVPTST